MHHLSKRLLILLTLLLACGFAAHAEDIAQDICARCTLESTVNPQTLSAVRREKISSYWDALEDGALTVSLPRGSTAQGVMLSFACEPPHLLFHDADGTLLADWNEGFYNGWIPFSRPSSKFTISRAEPGDFALSRLHVMTPGELPAWVQRWERLEGNAELLLISTHPDDDILWFGGMLPTYAGERDMKVQVAYMVGGRNRVRRIELLNALWHCGVHYYPDIGCFEDMGSAYLDSAYRAWGGEEQVDLYITRLLRKWQPQVIAAQDIKGEYGHLHHQITTKAIIKSVTTLCSDPAYDPQSAAEYGIAQPQKLYIHLYGENQIHLDWEQPLSAFGGKTGLQIAREAFKMHASQQSGKYHVSVTNRYSSALFGLYYSTVGPDVIGQDLFENVQ